MAKVHKTAAWQSVRRLVLANATTCTICGKPLDPSLKGPHPQSTSVDHIVPVSLGGKPYDLENLRPCHYGCNSRRGNRTRHKPVAATTTRNW